MTYTRHGHHIPGTKTDDEHGQVNRARCGGVILCSVCQQDAIRAIANLEGVSTFEVFPEDYYSSLDQFSEDVDKLFKRIRLFVVGSRNNNVEDDEMQISIEDMDIVSFTYILGGWKSMVSLHPLTKDGKILSEGRTIMFEITYDKAKEATYVVTYQKIAQDTFSQEGVDDAEQVHQETDRQGT